ncbi:MAG: glycosyltransferase family 2 protein [Actinomycetota bacterium]|nr:glycosyltransferase family 2 protein [Actinomycetota bacterium]
MIPALNEAGSIDWVLENIPAWVSEVVLVDGLSTDATEAVARNLRPDVVVVHQRQRGKGAALRAGFAAAHGDIIVMIDADGSTDPREMDRFVAALRSGADFVKGSRHMPGGGSVDFTRTRLLGNQVFVTLANLFFGVRFTDLCYGYCAFWRHHLEALALSADGFEIETQLVLNAVKAGLVIEEVPSVELERRAGSSNLNAFRDGRRVLATMIRERAPGHGLMIPDAARIELSVSQVAAHECDTWVPAGNDRRRGDRRTNREAPRIGVEWRVGERRRAPLQTSLVYVVHDGPPDRRQSELQRAA